MKHTINIPNSQAEMLAITCKKAKFAFTEDWGPTHVTFSFTEENQRNFIGDCLDALMGKSSPQNQWEPGTIIMGKDQSYPRSHYEVLADNGIMVMILFRRYRWDNGSVDQPEDCNHVLIRRKEFFDINTDHLLPPTDIQVTLPENWVKDYKDIKFYQPKFPELQYLVCPPEAFDPLEKPSQYEEWLKRQK